MMKVAMIQPEKVSMQKYISFKKTEKTNPKTNRQNG
jgi:hypothetical protein